MELRKATLIAARAMAQPIAALLVYVGMASHNPHLETMITGVIVAIASIVGEIRLYRQRRKGM